MTARMHEAAVSTVNCQRVNNKKLLLLTITNQQETRE